MLIAVGGNSRKAGKTGVICALIRAIPEADWTAIKISPHTHEAPGSGGDTGRFLAAGARRALLLDSAPDEWPSGDVIVESGSVADADVTVFVVDATKEWKASAGAAPGCADVVVVTGGEWAHQESGRPVFHAGPPRYESAELAAYIRALLKG